jgi:multidrug resistance efflux pump
MRPTASRLPRGQRWSPRIKLLAGGGGGLLCVGALVVVYLLIQNPFHKVRTDLVFHKVQYDTLELTVLERGGLESANNNDIYCRVKAKSQNTSTATSIKWVIDDGSHVKKGDLLVDLDDSGLQDQLKTQKIAVDKAESDKIQAEENYKIVVSLNQSDIQTKRTTLELAKIDLEKYQKGDFPQSLKDVEGRIKVAESDLEQQRDRAAWAQRMLKKGYYTVSQADSEQSKLQSLELGLAKVLEERRVLTDPAYGQKKRTETDLNNKVKQAADELERAISQAHAKEVQARTDREAKKSIYQQEVTRFKEIDDEIKKCKLYAPQDGLVVYYVPEQARFGSGTQQGIVAQGEPVREGQKLMQIPDLHHMLANVKVHEALVSRVHKGQKATIRVDSFPDQLLHGEIETVATVSSQQDYMSADVKVYTTKIAIHDELPGLKPGMNAEVTITIGDALQHVLTIPIQAVVGSAELGKHRHCFVNTPNGPEEREIVIGLSNEKMVHIKEGLKEGDEVVLNPRVLVGDTVKTRQPGSADKKKGSDDNGAEGKGDRKGPRPDRGLDGKGGPPDKAGPGPKPGAGGPPGGGTGGQPSPEDRQTMQKEMTDQFRKLSPEERKQRLEQIPEEYRGRVKQSLKDQGIEVKD